MEVNRAQKEKFVKDMLTQSTFKCYTFLTTVTLHSGESYPKNISSNIYVNKMQFIKSFFKCI